jgi:hypothetical protein
MRSRLARRTVTKYRKAMNIPSSHERREYRARSLVWAPVHHSGRSFEKGRLPTPVSGRPLGGSQRTRV